VLHSQDTRYKIFISTIKYGSTVKNHTILNWKIFPHKTEAPVCEEESISPSAAAQYIYNVEITEYKKLKLTKQKAKITTYIKIKNTNK
jgi:hypothetical protein